MRSLLVFAVIQYLRMMSVAYVILADRVFCSCQSSSHYSGPQWIDIAGIANPSWGDHFGQLACNFGSPWEPTASVGATFNQGIVHSRTMVDDPDAPHSLVISVREESSSPLWKPVLVVQAQ